MEKYKDFTDFARKVQGKRFTVVEKEDGLLHGIEDAEHGRWLCDSATSFMHNGHQILVALSVDGRMYDKFSVCHAYDLTAGKDFGFVIGNGSTVESLAERMTDGFRLGD